MPLQTWRYSAPTLHQAIVSFAPPPHSSLLAFPNQGLRPKLREPTADITRARELLVPVELRIRFPHRLEPPVPREVEMIGSISFQTFRQMTNSSRAMTTSEPAMTQPMIVSTRPQSLNAAADAFRSSTHFIAAASKGCVAADRQPPRTWGRRFCSRSVRALSGTEASASPASSTGTRTSGSVAGSAML